jgi:hypothetical protein
MEDFSVVSWEKLVESVRRKEVSPIFVPTVDNSKVDISLSKG